MAILNYKLSKTNELLTSRTGLLAVTHLMDVLGLDKIIDQHFPALKSNRSLPASTFINALILSQHDGGECLDDITHIAQDKGLNTLTNLSVPTPQAIGVWLRRLGVDNKGINAMAEVNKIPLSASLHNLKQVTLDIDASEVIANKKDAHWTYKNNKGYMPMVGHIAQTGQIVATDFREGNTSPAKGNLEFIQQCQKALPDGVKVNKLRIDAAGYQAKIIDYCCSENIQFVIRAKMSKSLKYLITDKDNQWQPLLNKKAQAIPGQDTFKLRHFIGNDGKVFDLIVQRKTIDGQIDLELDTQEETLETPVEIISGQYIYRAIATNFNDLSASEIVHFYNQRGEDSENRIKELKSDFGARQMPCGDFSANALYFAICSLSYNLFALMRQLLPVKFTNKRAKYVRNRLYTIAAKIVKTGRQIIVKCEEQYYCLLDEVLNNIKSFKPRLS